MITKFTPLVKYRKREVEKVESHLLSLNAMITKQKQKVKSIKDKINSTVLPKSGAINLLKEVNDMMIFQKIDQNKKYAKLLELQDEKRSINDKLHSANIDYEKAKYLDTQEIQKKLKIMKQKDENELNEVSIMLYNNKSVS